MSLVAFDFDGTLSDSEMTVLLAERAGVADEVAEITERAMNDELSYAESLYRRAELLGGLDEEAVAAAFDEVALRPGAGRLIERLQADGHHVAVLTGGFERGVDRALAKAGVEADTIVANRLPMAEGALTGEVEGPLIEGTKDDALESLAADLDVPMEATVAVGDGANDLPMLEVAGLAIGFVPKPAVRTACDAVVASMARLGKALEGYGVLSERPPERDASE
ncbi:phosphoserine phosphatase SerB [Halorubrum sp. CBA1125]|uniref:phosphoserine phosphatase SerB n=1 Tax=Halorubrum sp. CBA1125 TaxID=2668072 RepID=UPI0012E95E0C|nr:phosphoserine phosphatase SerB [Halorubrum sp. CBA1125]MUW15134.1 phosphoserine phosphatase SerB [Halorubrum sp. CBA1125]